MPSRSQSIEMDHIDEDGHTIGSRHVATPETIVHLLQMFMVRFASRFDLVGLQ